MAESSTRSALSAIPVLHRFLLTNVEPIFAFSGAIYLLFQASEYTSTLSRGIVASLQPNLDFIYTQLLGGWLHFAFTEAVVLRLVDDYRIWRLLCIGMLLSDVAYCHSCAQAVGGWREWLILGHWTKDDWTVAITTWPFVLARLSIVTGIGLNG